MYKRLLDKLTRTRLDDVLIDEGAIERSHVEDAQAESQMTGQPLSSILFERNEIDEWDLAKIVARNYSLPFVDVTMYTTPREVQAMLDLELCRRHMVVPFDVFGGIPAVAVCEVPEKSALDAIERMCGHPPFLYVTLRSKLLKVLDDREESGAAPANAAEALQRGPVEAGPTIPAMARGDDEEGGQSAGDLEPASMRLGFNMHMRMSRPTGPVTPRPARPRPAPKPVAAPASQAPSDPAADGDEADPTTGKVAAWQSIFGVDEDGVES